MRMRICAVIQKGSIVNLRRTTFPEYSYRRVRADTAVLSLDSLMLRGVPDERMGAEGGREGRAKRMKIRAVIDEGSFCHLAMDNFARIFPYRRVSLDELPIIFMSTEDACFDAS